MFQSEVLREETQPPRIRETLDKLKTEKFDPRTYLSDQFQFHYGSNEDKMIQNLKSHLEMAEKEIAVIEKELQKEKNELKQKEKLEKNNTHYQLQNINYEYKDLMTNISNLSHSVGLEFEQIKTIGEELNEINTIRDEKLMLSEIMEVFDIYQNNDKEGGISPEQFLKSKFKEGNANNLIIKLDCLRASLETLNYEEFIEAKKKINEDFKKAKRETYEQFRNYLRSENYQEARKMFNFIEKIGEIDGAEQVYEEMIAGRKEEKINYGIAEKDQHIREFNYFLFQLGMVFEQFQQDESIFNRVHKERAMEIFSRVSIRIMRNGICSLASSLLTKSLKEGKTEFFLFYLDEMSVNFEAFITKNKSKDKIWSVLETLSEAYKEIVEKHQTMYFEIEKNEFSHYLDQKITLKLEKIKKVEERANQEKSQDILTEKLKEIDFQLSNEEIEIFVVRCKSVFERCYRNSLAHMRADNCGDLLILFINKLSDYLDKLITQTELSIPNVMDPNPSRIELFSIVSKILVLVKRVDLFFEDFKSSITNMFKLDEAEKVKLQAMKDLSENISGTLNRSMRNLFAEVAQVWKHFKKKKKKKIKDFESASDLAKALCELVGTYLDFIFKNFNIDQKVNLMKAIGMEFLIFLGKKIPQEKYSENELIKLNIDLEEYDQQIIDFIDEPEVTEKKENLLVLVNLLKVPWDLLENYIEENDVYKKVDRHRLEDFIRCVRRMNKKK